MNGIGIILECDACVGFEIIDINVLVNVDDVLSLRVDFDKDVLRAHLLDDFSHVRSRFLEVMKLLTEHSDLGIECVSVGLEALEVCRAGLYCLKWEQRDGRGSEEMQDSSVCKYSVEFSWAKERTLTLASQDYQ